MLNEREALPALYDALAGALKELSYDAEVLFVDDGSTDGSAEFLAELVARDHRTRVVTLQENFGQSAALQAGFDRVRGEVVVTLDADLENDPADIAPLLRKLACGYDVVCGRRMGRGSSLRDLVSRLCNGFFRLWFRCPVTDLACTLRAYRSQALEGLVLQPGLHRYLPFLLLLRGSRLAEVPVRYRPRVHGHSKYTLAGRAWPTVRDFVRVCLRPRSLLRAGAPPYRVASAR